MPKKAPARSTKRLRILITNDDGYFADGIQALFTELGRDHHVWMVAPDREQSGSSHSLTVNRPLRVSPVADRQWRVDGTPTDSVMLATQIVFKGKLPDLIVSGINHGENMGDDVTYSGTVAGAIEGAILGVPSLAVSMANWQPGTPMTRAARWVRRFIPTLPKLGLEPTTFLNINFPLDGGKAYGKHVFTSQGFRRYSDFVVEKTDPRGLNYYWIGGKPTWSMLPGTDLKAVNDGYVSVTPMKLDFTHRDQLQRLAAGHPTTRSWNAS